MTHRRPTIVHGALATVMAVLPLAGPHAARAETATATTTGALPDPAPAGQWPTQVSAVYKINFGGLDIGAFRFQSKVQDNAYALTGQADVRAPLGAFEWKGTTNSAGRTASNGPKPQGYTFNFNSSALIGKDKSGAVKMGFKDGNVASYSVQPQKPPPPDAVPVTDAHRQNVLDPLSAVMALSLGGSHKPCDRRISIFDGKQRFDLALSYRRQIRIAEARPSGQPSIGFVCRIRYIPIAGHRDNEEVKKLAENGNMEITLRPVPSANLMIPHLLTIPTGTGTATMTAERVEITTQKKAQIAFGQ